jgi:DNA-binding NtrC family response regulator
MPLVAVPLTSTLLPAIRELASELELPSLEWRPLGAEGPPANASAVVILAAGREFEALELLSDLPPSTAPIYLVGTATEYRIAVAAVQRGARDYFALPADRDLLRRSLERDHRASLAAGAAARFAATERKTAGLGSILGSSPALRTVLDQAARVAVRGEVTVLLRGETGTGKELLARAIHYHSPRAAQPFVEINCAAIPGTLLESELFGHEKGAFTGATAAKAGLFELAHGGTLFLDEVGNLPLDLQPKLLRALESRAIRRVGGRAERRVDVRIVAATHVDLASAVTRREFREDLFYRLNVVSLLLPPLRYRDGDVELLAEHFAERLATSYGLPVPELTAPVRSRLRAYHWPGNVRELRNVIERALVLSPAGTLKVEEVLTDGAAPMAPDGVLPFPADLATLSRAAAHAMLDLSDGNKSEAARRLGISRPRLQRLLYRFEE